MKNLKNKTVLFVDDRFDLHRVYIETIRGHGAKITYADSVVAGIKHLDKSSFDLVVIDLHMELPSDLPEEVEKIAKQFIESTDPKMGMNVGQIIGIYINAKFSSITKFIYFSAVDRYYIQIPGGEPHGENKSLSKYDTSPDQLSSILNRIATKG